MDPRRSSSPSASSKMDDKVDDTAEKDHHDNPDNDEIVSHPASSSTEHRDLEKNNPPAGNEQNAHKDDDPFLARFEDNDPSNPRNWTTLYKSWLTLQLGFLALVGSMGSSIISPANDVISKEFNISSEVKHWAAEQPLLGRRLRVPAPR